MNSRPFQLRSCPKKYILDTHRSRTPEETLAFIATMKEALGMEDFRDATAGDRIGLPVFTCSRIRPDASRTYHTGKGLTRVQAQVSLTMEAIERYSSEYRDCDRNRLIKGSFRELSAGCRVLHPERLILPKFNDFREDVSYHWVEGFDLDSGEAILVPACSVYHPFGLDDPELMATHTNGVAAGNTMEEAVLHGLLEVIERDAWSIVKFGRLAAESVSIEDVPENDFLLSIAGKLRDAEIDVALMDYTLDLGIPVITAKAHDLAIDMLMPMEGFGAHLDPKAAASRALMEVATTRGLLFQQHGVGRLIEARPLYLFEAFAGDVLGDDPPTKSLSELAIGYSDDILADILSVSARLREHGLSQVIVINLTRDEIQIPTARVIIPGMEVYGFDPTRVGERLYHFL
ncbi:MAG TPA: YcaO-like family protein [Syntrophales bacterium]|nr:YcaO-like family protein [Syntrophales bacterium]